MAEKLGVASAANVGAAVKAHFAVAAAAQKKHLPSPACSASLVPSPSSSSAAWASVAVAAAASSAGAAAASVALSLLGDYEDRLLHIYQILHSTVTSSRSLVRLRPPPTPIFPYQQ